MDSLTHTSVETPVVCCAATGKGRKMDGYEVGGQPQVGGTARGAQLPGWALLVDPYYPKVGSP